VEGPHPGRDDHGGGASMRPRRGTPWKVDINLECTQVTDAASMRPRRGTPWKEKPWVPCYGCFFSFNAATEGNSVEGPRHLRVRPIARHPSFNAATEGNSVEGESTSVPYITNFFKLVLQCGHGGELRGRSLTGGTW